jgi:NAD(P)-dependent dehydrogenase (short-subunit alcohol dehydrogenase family)
VRAGATATAWVLVTGGSSGLGLECARRLVRSGRSVAIASRDPATRADAARRLEAERRRGGGGVLALDLDLSDPASVRRLAGEIEARSLEVDVLVCNAGILASRLERTAQGIERTFAVNHLGHFLLANLLLERLRASAPARIVVVSSAVHDPRRFTLMPRPGSESPARLARDGASTRGRFDGRRTYAASKLCNLWFAFELSRRIERARLAPPGRPIEVAAFDPGLVPGSGLARHHSAIARTAWTRVLPVATLALAPFFPTIGSLRRSGAALARLALEPVREDARTRYVASHTRWRESSSSRASRDESRARDLWETSVELSGLRPGESSLA